MSDGGFRECATCAAKMGSPILCESCIANRKYIEELEARLMTMEYQEAERIEHEEPARQLSPELLDKIISIVLQGYGFGISKIFPLEQVRRDILKELGEQG